MEKDKMIQMLITLLKKAIACLFINDKRNIDMQVSEMNLCARLAHYLENEIRQYILFDGYYVDTEYNKTFGNMKKRVIYSDGKLHSVRCDLLIHSRGLLKPDNLLALEMKKEKVDSNVEDDHDRLQHIILPRTNETPIDAVCDTVLGVFLRIEKKGYVLTKYWYDNGIKSVTEKFELKIKEKNE